MGSAEEIIESCKVCKIKYVNCCHTDLLPCYLVQLTGKTQEFPTARRIVTQLYDTTLLVYSHEHISLFSLL